MIRAAVPAPGDSVPPRPRASSAAAAEETIKLELPEDLGAIPQRAIAAALHRRAAEHLVRAGNPRRACEALLGAANAAELDVPLAAWLVQLSQRTGMDEQAADALEHCIALLPDVDAAPLRRVLARLYRKLGNLARAREHLAAVAETVPDDRRARRALATLSMREGRTETAIATLAQEEQLAADRGRYRSAHRSAMTRARLLDERLGRPREAADAYASAAEHARAAREVHPALSAAILSARALVAARAPFKEIDLALRTVGSAGRAAGRASEAETIRSGLKKRTGAGQAKALAGLGEQALKRGAHDEAAALFRAAWEAAPNEEALANRLEAFFVQRAAWHDLAGHYRERLKRTSDRKLKAQLYGRLAELLEDELEDGKGAAEAYAAMVELTGDSGALSEQMRLLAGSSHPGSMLAALDAAVEKALSPAALAEALVMRGEVHKSSGRLGHAAEDFERALSAAPGEPRALAGLAECRPERANLAAFEAAVLCLPRGKSGRAPLMKRLARLVDTHGNNPARARALWRDALAEAPGDAEAEARALELARSSSDTSELVLLLRRKLAAAPRGPQARECRRELASSLQQLGRHDEMLDELRTGANADPGDAWCLTSLAEQCEKRKLHGEAAWALEGAAAATPAGPARADLWLRLGKLYRQDLRDPVRAAECEQRASAVLEEQRRREARRETGERHTALLPAPDAQEAVTSQVEIPEEELAAAQSAETILEIHTGDIVEVKDGGLAIDLEPVRSRTPSFVLPALETNGPARAKFAEARAEELRRLRERVEAEPLDPDLYRLLADGYDAAKDGARGVLMREIADALEGDPFAEPLPPKRTLSGRDWSALRHSELRGPAIELFSLAGAALCGVYAQSPKEAGARRPFSMDEGAGSRACADALLAAVRVLGIRAGDVYLSEATSPPFMAVNTEPPRLLVGRSAANRALPAGELRFFAARALCTLRLDILPLRMLTPPELTDAIRGIAALVDDERPKSKLARPLSKRLSPKSHDRLLQLLQTLEKRPPDFEKLAEAARHSANRAGLVVAGAVAPAVRALRAKRGATVELAELLRFAASDRYLAVSGRR